MVSARAVSTENTHSNSPDPRLQKATQEFEAMLISQLLKMGSDEEQATGELDGGGQTYQDLRNQAVATALANNGGLGIGRMLRQHFGPVDGH